MGGICSTNYGRFVINEGSYKTFIEQSDNIRIETMIHDGKQLITKMSPNYVMVKLTDSQKNTINSIILYKCVKLENVYDNIYRLYFNYNPKENIMDDLLKSIRENKFLYNIFLL
jgi:hypothetical protein